MCVVGKLCLKFLNIAARKCGGTEEKRNDLLDFGWYQRENDCHLFRRAAFKEATDPIFCLNKHIDVR